MDLHWLTVQQHDLCKVLILTYQAYHNTAPDYSCDLINPYSYSCNLRFNNQLHDYMYIGYTQQIYIWYSFNCAIIIQCTDFVMIVIVLASCQPTTKLKTHVERSF